MEYKYREGYYYQYKLDTFKDLKVVVQYVMDMGVDIEALVPEFDDGYYIVKGKLNDCGNWEIGDQGKHIVDKLKLSKAVLIDKILNYDASEYIACLDEYGSVTVRDGEFIVKVIEEGDLMEGSSVEMINIGELVKYYYYDDDGDEAVVVFCHYHYNGSLERLEKNLSK